MKLRNRWGWCIRDIESETDGVRIFSADNEDSQNNFEQLRVKLSDLHFREFSLVIVMKERWKQPGTDLGAYKHLVLYYLPQ